MNEKNSNEQKNYNNSVKKIFIAVILLLIVALLGVLIIPGLTKDKGKKDIKPTDVVQLKSPTNVKIEDSVLTWDSVKNASGYIVYVDGVAYPVDKAEFDLTEVDPGSTITVKAVGEGKYVNSNESAEQEIPVPEVDQTLFEITRAYLVQSLTNKSYVLDAENETQNAYLDNMTKVLLIKIDNETDAKANVDLLVGFNDLTVEESVINTLVNYMDYLKEMKASLANAYRMVANLALLTKGLNEYLPAAVVEYLNGVVSAENTKNIECKATARVSTYIYDVVDLAGKAMQLGEAEIGSKEAFFATKNTYVKNLKAATPQVDYFKQFFEFIYKGGFVLLPEGIDADDQAVVSKFIDNCVTAAYLSLNSVVDLMYVIDLDTVNAAFDFADLLTGETITKYVDFVKETSSYLAGGKSAEENAEYLQNVSSILGLYDSENEADATVLNNLIKLVNVTLNATNDSFITRYNSLVEYLTEDDLYIDMIIDVMDAAGCHPQIAYCTFDFITNEDEIYYCGLCHLSNLECVKDEEGNDVLDENGNKVYNKCKDHGHVGYLKTDLHDIIKYYLEQKIYDIKHDIEQELEDQSIDYYFAKYLDPIGLPLDFIFDICCVDILDGGIKYFNIPALDENGNIMTDAEGNVIYVVDSADNYDGIANYNLEDMFLQISKKLSVKGINGLSKLLATINAEDGILVNYDKVIDIITEYFELTDMVELIKVSNIINNFYSQFTNLEEILKANKNADGSYNWDGILEALKISDFIDLVDEYMFEDLDFTSVDTTVEKVAALVEMDTTLVVEGFTNILDAYEIAYNKAVAEGFFAEEGEFAKITDKELQEFAKDIADVLYGMFFAEEEPVEKPEQEEAPEQEQSPEQEETEEEPVVLSFEQLAVSALRLGVYEALNLMNGKNTLGASLENLNATLDNIYAQYVLNIEATCLSDYTNSVKQLINDLLDDTTKTNGDFYKSIDEVITSVNGLLSLLVSEPCDECINNLASYFGMDVVTMIKEIVEENELAAYKEYIPFALRLAKENYKYVDAAAQLLDVYGEHAEVAQEKFENFKAHAEELFLELLELEDYSGDEELKPETVAKFKELLLEYDPETTQNLLDIFTIYDLMSLCLDMDIPFAGFYDEAYKYFENEILHSDIETPFTNELREYIVVLEKDVLSYIDEFFSLEEAVIKNFTDVYGDLTKSENPIVATIASILLTKDFNTLDLIATYGFNVSDYTPEIADIWYHYIPNFAVTIITYIIDIMSPFNWTY